jgi:hypothetical protein
MASKSPEAVPISPEILSQLECPVCYESFIGQKIYVCSTGHSVCESCLPKLTKCPTCNGPLSKIRAYGLEKLADTVLVFCKNRRLGCARLITGSELKKHEANCDWGCEVWHQLYDFTFPSDRFESCALNCFKLISD